MTLPLADRIPQWPWADDDETRAVGKVLASGQWGSAAGTEVKAFEKEFADYHGAGHGLAIGNGTLALMAALAALDLPEGSEVVVPSYTFYATAAAPLAVGLIPVYADVVPGTHLLDPAAVEAVVTPHTKAVIPVHMAGIPADMDGISAVAERRGLRVIEDAAQATGARFRGRPMPVGDIATFSFQTSKNITAGEGGALLTNDDDLADRLFSVINVGRVQGGGWYEHPRFGLNLRLSELQGAVLRVQLARHPQLQARRAAGAERLRRCLEQVEGLVLPAALDEGSVHGQHLFLMRFPGISAEQRAALLDDLHRGGLSGASAGYVPLHRLDSLEDRRRRLAAVHGRTLADSECPHTDGVAAETVWLPQNVLLADEATIDEVGALLAGAWQRVGAAAGEARA